MSSSLRCKSVHLSFSWLSPFIVKRHYRKCKPWYSIQQIYIKNWLVTNTRIFNAPWVILISLSHTFLHWTFQFKLLKSFLWEYILLNYCYSVNDNSTVFYRHYVLSRCFYAVGILKVFVERIMNCCLFILISKWGGINIKEERGR